MLAHGFRKHRAKGAIAFLDFKVLTKELLQAPKGIFGEVEGGADALANHAPRDSLDGLLGNVLQGLHDLEVELHEFGLFLRRHVLTREALDDADVGAGGEGFGFVDAL